ncbi:putative F-box domain, leucine-rich repeat domain superfamily, F-box-like domain superfamily [Helianthus annuus]|uniref:F-box domain, leucine-rich repeat domain superfamily, F-box-like domain superfamily n=1 Tax=Helianthus annuus TaxID=4232 RepID=A0A251S7B3_HELAN|nr:F-box/LRR-repeat protein 7 [Helianthus annuus]KAF5763889.1 putative F-box domain, leucine-rich repeat domain superfamily, F-box-like domain superfamily [Helianthus annuus]KAJ0450651.1 putative F-box domain, leucine-rich repeat domain superfamily, F-box-like domain superfamily [Helianthus annuus]KAJ0454881.1 putative F-box domain, leucine-rich repeat domain superfamily, F-box-like domain superfamily [Helianthus annuus]KAJ0472498.1 putative F-box domain, leucine-rich repeat domain superfamily,
MDTILCDELLQEIFHHLPPPSSSAVSLVSKRWRHLLRSSLSSLSLRLSPNHPSLPSLSSFLSHHTSLSTLSVSSSSSAGTTVFSGDLLRSISAASPQLLSLSIILSRPLLSLQLLTSFTNLKSLTLSLAENASPDSVSDEFTVSSSLRLQSLRLSGICAGDYSLNWLWKNCDCKTLTKLVLENCEGVGDNSSFACFVKGLENVREVELRTCRSIVSLILFNLGENCKSLVSLLVYDGGNKESLLRFVRETTSDLRRLDLRLPLDLDDTHLFQIGVKFSRLRVLRLQSCCMVTGEGLKTLGLALSDSLEELALTNCDVINGQDGFLVELAQNLKKIKILDLSYNHTLLDKEFASMISSYCNLRKLKLRGCSRLTNVSLISLCKNCKRLESVDILYCHGIQVEGVEFLILNSRQLRNLQVEDRKLSEAARRWMTDKFIEVQH